MYLFEWCDSTQKNLYLKDTGQTNTNIVWRYSILGPGADNSWPLFVNELLPPLYGVLYSPS